MPSNDLQYRLTADPTRMEKGFKSAEASAAAFEKELARLEAQQARVESAMADVGTGFLAGGAAIAAGLGIATKAAISWESAWTGVAKVVDGSPQQLAALEAELRQLAKTLPQTHEEIAAVAGAAGQLGVARQDITRFTKVMLDLGTATNLTAEEASFALARLMNIMQTSATDVTRLGATIVELGNNSATTEADILTMGLRIAGAGKTIGLSEAQVLGYAAALSSVGVEADAGGSAISRTFIIIESAVRKGGKAVEEFASIAGMSADEFVRAYQEDAGKATASFITGLGRLQAAGGDVFASLNRLKLQDIELRDSLLRLAGAGDLVVKSLATANRGWDENTALVAEAERRYATVEARMAIAKNQVNDFAISMGQTFLPVVGAVVDTVGNLASVLNDLPGPAKTILGIVAALAAAVSLLGGMLLVATPAVAAHKAAIETLANAEGRLAAATVFANRAMSATAGFLAGPWGIAIGIAVVALSAFGLSQAETKGEIQDLTQTLDAQTGAITDGTRAWIVNKLQQEGSLKLAKGLGLDLKTVTDAILGEQAAIDEINKVLGESDRLVEAYRQSLLEQGKSTEAAGIEAAKYRMQLENTNPAAVELQKTVGDMTGKVAEARKEWQLKRDAMGTAQVTMEQLDPEVRRIAASFNLSAVEAKGLADAVNTLDKEFQALLSQLFGVEEAEDAAAAAMNRMVEAAKKNKGELKGNSEAALENRDNMREVIAKHLEVIQAMAAHGASSQELQAKLKELKADFIKQATQAGLSETAVKEYAAAYDQVPAVVETTIKAKTEGFGKVFADIARAMGAAQRAANAAGSGSPPKIDRGQQKAGGGMIGGSYGLDVVPIMATRGEHVSTVSSAMRNQAALDAGNAGARLAVAGTPGAGAAGGSGAAVHNTWQIYPQKADFGPRDLDLLMAQQEARDRAGRAV